MTVETFPWNVQDHLGSAERQVGFLQAALEDGDPALIAAALSDIAKARGIPIDDIGLPGIDRQDATVPNEGQRFSTVVRAMKALGMRFAVVAEPSSIEPV